VKHEFDTKLENLKAELKTKEEVLKADLRVKENELAALRGGAMSAIASRQMAIDKRRLKAIDQLWDAFNKLAPLRNMAEIIAVYDFDAAAKAAESNPKLRQAFEMLAQLADPAKIDFGEAHKARPFVSPMGWAYFAAYNAIAMQAMAKAQVLRFGMPAKLVSNDKITNLVKTALPEFAATIDQHGDAIYHYLLEILESKLLTELQRMLTDTEAFRANVEQAAQIVQQSNSLMESARESGAAQTAGQGNISETHL
jgi:hypothetical protein